MGCVSAIRYFRHGILIAFRVRVDLPQVDIISFRVELSLASEASCEVLDREAAERVAKSLRPAGPE